LQNIKEYERRKGKQVENHDAHEDGGGTDENDIVEEDITKLTDNLTLNDGPVLPVPTVVDVEPIMNLRRSSRVQNIKKK
jgi:hypothetical protein